LPNISVILFLLAHGCSKYLCAFPKVYQFNILIIPIVRTLEDSIVVSK